MMPYALKRMYFAVAKPLLAISGTTYRLLRSPPTGNQAVVRVQLGPGQRNYLDGWVNVDANMFTGRCDVWTDISRRLPFRDESVDAVYSHHVIEHLPDLWGHFREVFRILKPGGVVRVGGPNGDAAMREYVAGNTAWFGDYPDPRKSIGGRFENFVFCRREHITILTPSYLEEITAAVGFVDFAPRAAAAESGFPHLFDAPLLGKESEPTPHSPHTLVIEAVKPRA